MNIKGVSQYVTQQLRLEIVSGTLPGGARLNEAELACRLEISRPPLREAFRRLESEGLVVSIPRRGCFVAETSEEDWEHISRTRKMIEVTSIEIIANKRWREFPLMRRAHERIVELERPNPEEAPGEVVAAWFETLSNFHLCLVESSRNNWLAHCYKQLCPSMARYQVMYLYDPGAKHSSVDEHAEILGLLESGLYGDAMAQLVEHMDRVRRQLMRKMQKIES